MRQNDNRFQRLSRFLTAGFWIIMILIAFRYRDVITVDGIVNYAPGNPVLAALVLLGLFAFKGVAVSLYLGILYAASGILFSLPAAVALNLTGSVLMVSIP